jgi:hypothetical protein
MRNAQYNRLRRDAQKLVAVLNSRDAQDVTDADIAFIRGSVESMTKCAHEYNALRNAMNAELD